jgi:hypothetical protein
VYGLVFDLIRDLVAALPAGLVLLGGFGAALLLARKSLPAAALFGLGLLALGLDLVLEVLVPTALLYTGRTGVVAMTIYGLLESVIRGLGYLLCLVAACVGPAPKREEEDY